MVVATIAFSCGTKKSGETDTNEVAKEENNDKFQSREGEKDAEFVAKTVACNFGDIQLSQLAEQKSNDPQVKEVAKELEANHSKLLKELQSLAEKKAISVPSEPEDAQKKKIEDLTREADVIDFNKKWCKEMVSSHESTIKEFETRWASTEDPELKNWIAETLPHLRSHLDKIKSTDESVAKEFN